MSRSTVRAVCWRAASRRHEAGRRRSVRQDAFVDVEHEDLVEIEPPAFQQAQHLQAGEGFAFEVHGVLSHPPLQLGPGIGQFGFAPEALHAPDVQGHDVPESGPGSRQPRIADVVFRVHGPGGHGFENDRGAVVPVVAGLVAGLPPRIEGLAHRRKVRQVVFGDAHPGLAGCHLGQGFDARGGGRLEDP